MTRIAVIADIHSNLPALNAVLEDIESCSVDEVLVNGDLVGRGPQGSAVLRRVRRLGLRSTRGNHEDYMLSFRRREVPEDWLEAEEWNAARWMAAELSDDDIDFIDALPFTLTSDLEPQLRLFHGSPRSHSEGLGGWTPDEKLREHLESIEEQVLVVAHTHRPLHWQTSDGLIVNVGSVGLPFNGDSRAQYAVFEGTGSTFDVSMRQVEYDRDRSLEAFESTGFITEGGATAFLLRKELVTARPHLVPFLKWAEATGRTPLMSEVDEFLEIFDPELSMRELAKQLELVDEPDESH